MIYMSQGHRSKLLGTDAYNTNQRNWLLPCIGRHWEERKQEQETEKKVCWNIAQNQGHHFHQYTQNKMSAFRKVDKLNISILRPLIQVKMSNLISKFRVGANFNDYIEEKVINHQSEHNLHSLSKALACAFCSCINWWYGLYWPILT